MRLVKLLANLGYGSRKEMQAAIRNGWVTDKDGNPIKADSKLPHEDILFDDEPLDPPEGSVILLNKPLGYTCSMKDRGRLVFDLLPDRYRVRKPALSFVGRLDKDTTGLLLFTDDGKLLHQIISPKADAAKIYEVELDRPMTGGEADQFASGEMMLENETKPLKPAELEVLSETTARLTLHEGRYHQVRRMFAATGNHVTKLHRAQLGNLTLDGVEEGSWKLLSQDDIDKIFG
ncbi:MULTISPECIES: pseudouridine synthase [unclassified Pseudovibrio]|uniref:pseudouridine synthase n=1 Tax=unclassified Pseudovibrio TaxID=2627060 RepID=UPI0007AE6661|nr:MULTISPECIES: pseudouridine synthase [unclassified Pseudovibrio]KZL26994.1 Ribosomal small subunit pseudouridine synthase A [Pseudovibrio sp. Ad37]KZL27915.1 Ribosomal small subunit pseudouridine synthase A [Pseudovibrio sp. WM33]